MQVARDQIPLRRVVQQAIAIVDAQANRREIQILDEATCDPDVTFVGDEDRARQILTSLLGNAVKFTAPGGRIRIGYSVTDEVAPGVSARGSGTWLRVDVEDTGMGIPDPADGDATTGSGVSSPW